MSINAAISIANAVIFAGMLLTGIVFFWQAWKRNALIEWPPSVLVLLGIVPFLLGLAWGQILFFRLSGLDVTGPFGMQGVGTAALRWLVAIVVIMRLHRVMRGSLLTPQDRARMDGGG